MDILLTIVIATILLGLLVFIHEGGHFLAARAFGVRVTEFMIGLPGPSIGFNAKGTRFGVTAIPLGGYAAVCGMGAGERSPYLKQTLDYMYKHGTADMEDVADFLGITDDETYKALEELCEWGSLIRPKRKDKHNTYRTPALINNPYVLPDEKAGESNAKTLAHKEGAPAVITNLESFFAAEEKQQYSSLPFWKRIIILLAGPGMNLIYAMVAFVVIYSILGVDLQLQSGEVVHYVLSPLDSIVAGFEYIGMVAVAIVGLFNPATAAETVSNSTSIVGIAVLSKSAFEQGFVSLLSFSAVISVSLGLANMLPIPPLDGGRFVIEIYQKIVRRNISIRALNFLSVAGMCLFFAFFVFMVNQDVQRFVFGNWS
jgi:regulator of sigma E protease